MNKKKKKQHDSDERQQLEETLLLLKEGFMKKQKMADKLKHSCKLQPKQEAVTR